MACHEIGQAIAIFSSKVRRWITVLLEAMLRIENPQDIFSFALWSHCGRHWFGLWIAALLRWLALPGDLDLSRPHFNIFCSCGADLTPFGLRKWRGRLGCFCGNRSFCIHCTCFWGIHKSTLGLVNPREQVTIFTDAIWCHMMPSPSGSNLFQSFSEVYTVYCLLNPRPLSAEISYWPATASTSPLDVSSSPPALDQPLPEGPWVTLTDNFSVLWAINMASWRWFWQFNEERCNEKHWKTKYWNII